MTYQELKQRQSWSLNQKIDHAVGAIEGFISKSGKTPYVSFSGGKDSTVLLDICRRFVDKDMKAVFCNTGNEWKSTVEFVKEFDNIEFIHPDISIKNVIDKHGFPLISKEQSQYIREAKYTKSEKLRDIRLNGREAGKFKGKISDRWKFLVYEYFDVSEKCCKFLKKYPFKKYEKSTGNVPIIGIMADESYLRQSEYIKRNGCNSFKGKIASYPISIFTNKDSKEYINKFGLKISPIYDNPEITQTGCKICGFGCHKYNNNSSFKFELLHKLEPKSYDIFMSYENNGVTYREALKKVGVELPDENRQYKIFT